MSKTPAPMNQLDAVAQLIDELRTERADARRYQQETDARVRALEADLAAAKAAAAGVNPMPGGDANATQALLSHFDRGLHARMIEEKTRTFMENLDKETCETYRRAMAGDVLFYVMVETGPQDNSSGRVISHGMTSRIIGVSSPDESPEVRRELAIAKWARLVGARNRPEFMYVAQVPADEVDEIRAAFEKAFADKSGNNALIDLSVSFVRRAIQREVEVKLAAKPRQEDLSFPDRYSAEDSANTSAIKPLFQGVA